MEDVCDSSFQRNQQSECFFTRATCRNPVFPPRMSCKAHVFGVIFALTRAPLYFPHGAGVLLGCFQPTAIWVDLKAIDELTLVGGFLPLRVSRSISCASTFLEGVLRVVALAFPSGSPPLCAQRSSQLQALEHCLRCAPTSRLSNSSAAWMQRNEILNVNFKNVEPKRLRKIVLVTFGVPLVKNRRKIGGKIMVESIFHVIISFLSFPPIRLSSILHFAFQHLQRVSEILRGCARAPDEVPTSPLRPAIMQDVSLGLSGRRTLA